MIINLGTKRLVYFFNLVIILNMQALQALQVLQTSLNFPKIFKFISAYGNVQIYARDLGIELGGWHKQLVQSEPIQLIMIYAWAYMLIKDFTLAFIVTLMYYGLNVLPSVVIKQPLQRPFQRAQMYMK